MRATSLTDSAVPVRCQRLSSRGNYVPSAARSKRSRSIPDSLSEFSVPLLPECLIPSIFTTDAVQIRSRQLSGRNKELIDADNVGTELQVLLFAEALDIPFERLEWLK